MFALPRTTDFLVLFLAFQTPWQNFVEFVPPGSGVQIAYTKFAILDQSRSRSRRLIIQKQESYSKGTGHTHSYNDTVKIGNRMYTIVPPTEGMFRIANNNLFKLFYSFMLFVFFLLLMLVNKDYQ